MSQHTLSIIVPCYNEERTLEKCILRLLRIASDALRLEIVIVDDCSTDLSMTIARTIAQRYGSMIVVLGHAVNQGKGAAIRTGMAAVTGDFVAIQDADLEYNPEELLKLIEPLKEGRADAVFGSRFLSAGANRVLYFWHTMGNKFLTFLSNMFTDLNLTDMETCYKVFRRDKLLGLTLQENRFGFDPEIVAKAAQKKLRIYEIGISYDGRTYEEGKKIGWKDGFRALYCIFHYNAFALPLPMQLLIYFFIGGFSALINLASFVLCMQMNIPLIVSACFSFAISAFVNYRLCIHWLFKHNVRWSLALEIFYYCLFVTGVGAMDVMLTYFITAATERPFFAKAIASLLGFVINFAGRKLFIFRR